MAGDTRTEADNLLQVQSGLIRQASTPSVFARDGVDKQWEIQVQFAPVYPFRR